MTAYVYGYCGMPCARLGAMSDDRGLTTDNVKPRTCQCIAKGVPAERGS